MDPYENYFERTDRERTFTMFILKRKIQHDLRGETATTTNAWRTYSNELDSTTSHPQLHSVSFQRAYVDSL